MLCYGKLIPNRGAWLEFETSNKDVLSVKVDRKRKIPVTTLLRAICSLQDYPKDILGTGSDEDLLRIFQRGRQRRRIIRTLPRTIDKEPADTRTPRQAPSSSSTSGCAPATRRRWRTPASSLRACSSASAATTWARLAATS